MAGVKTEHDDYKANLPVWKRCRDVLAGQDAVHKAGVAYLPKLRDQEQSEYAAYVMRTAFVNYSWRTVSAMKGLLLRKAPLIIVPSAIEPMLEDVSLAGVPFSVFVQTVIDEILSVGRVGILVDHPAMVTPDGDKELTKADADDLGLRPVMKIYKAESIINWKYRLINNKFVLSMVVFCEHITTKDPDDEFCDKSSVQYRVLDLDEAADNTYRVRIFVSVDGKDIQVGDTVVPLMDGQPLESIPFNCIGVSGLEPNVDLPPMIDLFDLNLSHYRTNADYEHACHFTGLPTPWVAGYNDKSGFAEGVEPTKFHIGSQAIMLFPDAETKCGYMEFTGQGLTALKENKEGKETQMAMLGSRLLSSDKSGVEAFQTVAIRNNGETSILAGISLLASLGILASINIFTEWGGADTASNEFQINRDFMSVTMDAPTLLALLANVQAGTLSKESFFDLLQRGDVVDQDLTFEEEQSRIDSQPLPMPTDATTPLTPRKPAVKPKPATVR